MIIKQPCLLLDVKKCKANISKMAQKATKNNLIFRPHFKTHQSAEIGEWFRDCGVKAITVSSVQMAEYFASNGWDEITIAFPVNILEIESINKLSGSIQINLLIESIESVEYLIKNLENKTGVFIKIDTGYHRTGIDCANSELIDSIIRIIANQTKLDFKGFLTHNGHTYKASSKDEIINIHTESISKLTILKKKYIADFPDHIVSLGDTPACSIAENFTGVDEIRPGNFVFYDIMQSKLGSCTYQDIAVALVCPVVAVHSERCEAVIYGGGIHLSKEYIVDSGNTPNYGYVAEFSGGRWEHPLSDTFVKSLSQEHGVIKTTKKHIEKFRTGGLITILPVHSCLTASHMNYYETLGDKRVEMMRLS